MDEKEKVIKHKHHDKKEISDIIEQRLNRGEKKVKVFSDVYKMEERTRDNEEHAVFMKIEHDLIVRQLLV